MDELKRQLGSCMTQAQRTVKKILKDIKTNQNFQNDELRALMGFHPHRKIVKFDHFCKTFVPPFFRPSLAVVTNGEVKPVSWNKCLRNLYGKHDPKQVKRDRIIQAFREEICQSPCMVQAREKFSTGKCAGCSKKTKLHIDHDVLPFAQIMDEFLESKKLDMMTITLNYKEKPFVFKSRKLATEWVAWHDEHATLLGLCKICNSSKGSSGYRRKRFVVAHNA